jgi:hypothetical protein
MNESIPLSGVYFVIVAIAPGHQRVKFGYILWAALSSGTAARILCRFPAENHRMTLLRAESSTRKPPERLYGSPSNRVIILGPFPVPFWLVLPECLNAPGANL